MTGSLQLDHFAAQRETYFTEHWIDTPAFQNAAKPELPIIFGAKGCGKSALARYLADIRTDKRISCRRIDLAELKHRRIISQLKSLVEKIQTDDATVLSNYWRHLFLVHFLADASVTADPDGDLKAETALYKVRAVLSRMNHTSQPGRWLVDVLSKAARLLDQLLVEPKTPDELVLASGLTLGELEKIEKFPEDDEFVEGCMAAAALLTRQSRQCCIVVDGLDVISESDRDAHPIVLGAIIKAVKRLSLDGSLNDALSIKVLVPKELFFALDDRDLDHYVTLQAHLTWEPHTLFALLDRRVSAASRRAGRGSKGLDMLLPDEILGGRRVFDHLLRHSMYRPRQLLVYLKAIFDRAEDRAVHADDVMQAVRSTSTDLANYFVKENKYRFPQLRSHLEALSGFPSVVPIGRLTTKFGDGSGTALSVLYESGSLGIIEESPVGVPRDPSGSLRKTATSHELISCEFVYKPGARPFMLPGLPDETLVAIHPMLHRRFGISENHDYVIG